MLIGLRMSTYFLVKDYTLEGMSMMRTKWLPMAHGLFFQTIWVYTRALKVGK